MPRAASRAPAAGAAWPRPSWPRWGPRSTSSPRSETTDRPRGGGPARGAGRPHARRVAREADPSRGDAARARPASARSSRSGERLEPLGADELDWELLGDVESVYFTAGDAGRARRTPARRDRGGFPARQRGARDEHDRRARVQRAATTMSASGRSAPRRTHGCSWRPKASAAGGGGVSRRAAGRPRPSRAGARLLRVWRFVRRRVHARARATATRSQDAAALGAEAGARALTRIGAP